MGLLYSITTVQTNELQTKDSNSKQKKVQQKWNQTQKK